MFCSTAFFPKVDHYYLIFLIINIMEQSTNVSSIFNMILIGKYTYYKIEKYNENLKLTYIHRECPKVDSLVVRRGAKKKETHKRVTGRRRVIISNHDRRLELDTTTRSVYIISFCFN